MTSVLANNSQITEQHIKVQCELLGKFGSFGWWVQLFLFGCCFCSLIYKRFHDEVRRSWLVWFFDTSKQGFGAMLAHGLNIALAKTFDALVSVEADACNWYFINITMDTTFGCVIVIILLKVLTRIYVRCLKRPDLARIGEYGDPPNYKIWRRQLADYMVLTIVEKAIMVIAVVIAAPTLTSVVGILLSLFDNFPQVKLTIVMVIWPILCSVMYFWVVDNFLKADDKGTLITCEDNDSRTPKVRASSTILDEEVFSFEEWKDQIPR